MSRLLVLMTDKNSLKRLYRDLTDLRNDEGEGYVGHFHIEPLVVPTITEEGTIEENRDMYHWEGYIMGPKETPYQGGKFKVSIKISNKYPYVPPLVKFITKIYHPNIDLKGNICLNILKPQPGGDWSPTLNIGKLMLSICNLLSDPNPNDPLNPEAGKLYTSNRSAFEAKAIAMTNDYAEMN